MKLLILLSVLLGSCKTTEKSRSQLRATDEEMPLPKSLEEIVEIMKKGPDLAAGDKGLSTSIKIKARPIPRDILFKKGRQSNGVHLLAKDDYIQGFVNKKYPASMDMRMDSLPIRDQGDTGWCTAFAGVAALELAYYNKTKEKIDLSEKDFWSHYRVPACDQSMLENVGVGIPLESDWPFNGVRKSNLKCVTGLTRFVLTESFSKVFQYLSERKPVAMGTLIDQDFVNSLGTSGVVFVGKNTPKSIGGHAMLAVGYHYDESLPFESKVLLILKNSWGSYIGDAGFHYVPLEYFAKNEFEGYTVEGTKEYEQGQECEGPNHVNPKFLPEEKPDRVFYFSGGVMSLSTMKVKTVEEAVQACKGLPAPYVWGLISVEHFWASVAEGILDADLNPNKLMAPAFKEGFWMRDQPKSEGAIFSKLTKPNQLYPATFDLGYALCMAPHIEP